MIHSPVVFFKANEDIPSGTYVKEVDSCLVGIANDGDLILGISREKGKKDDLIQVQVNVNNLRKTKLVDRWLGDEIKPLVREIKKDKIMDTSLNKEIDEKITEEKTLLQRKERKVVLDALLYRRKDLFHKIKIHEASISSHECCIKGRTNEINELEKKIEEDKKLIKEIDFIFDNDLNEEEKSLLRDLMNSMKENL